ncbi:MAG: helix-turn-helix domain-containing protein [Pseudomonadota bacterium]
MIEKADHLPKQQPERAIHARWGDLTDVGFTAVPNTLIQAQSALGLTSTDIVILLNFTLHWWDPDSHPYPRSNTIARRTGLSTRTVQRTIKSLEERGFIKRFVDRGERFIDLTPLRDKLKEVAPAFAWQRGKAAAKSSGERLGIQSQALGEL